MAIAIVLRSAHDVDVRVARFDEDVASQEPWPDRMPQRKGWREPDGPRR